MGALLSKVGSTQDIARAGAETSILASVSADPNQALRRASIREREIAKRRKAFASQMGHTRKEIEQLEREGAF